MISAERKITFLKPHQKDGVQKAIKGQLDFEDFAQQHGGPAATRLENLVKDIKRDPRLLIGFSFNLSHICQPDCEQQSANCDADSSRRIDEEVNGKRIVGKTKPAACFFHIPTGKNGS